MMRRILELLDKIRRDTMTMGTDLGMPEVAATATEATELLRKERVICAAIWVDDGQVHDHQYENITRGVVFAGWRHHNCIALAHIAFGDRGPEWLREQVAGRNQGFITSSGRFVDRELAAEIALKAGQIAEPKSGLHSEDLY